MLGGRLVGEALGKASGKRDGVIYEFMCIFFWQGLNQKLDASRKICKTPDGHSLT